MNRNLIILHPYRASTRHILLAVSTRSMDSLDEPIFEWVILT